jgi:pyruvate dehydrogenase E1 component alpha subunit
VAVREAAALARAGDGPSLIEAVTYRLGPHTTADDPDRYRAGDEGDEWEAKDPLARIKTLLEQQGQWSEEWQSELEARSSEIIERAVDWAESVPPPTFEEMLHRMYATPTAPIRRRVQRACLHGRLVGAFGCALGRVQRACLHTR